MRITLSPLHLSNYNELNVVTEFRLHMEIFTGYDSTDFMSLFLFPNLILILSLSSPGMKFETNPVHRMVH